MTVGVDEWLSSTEPGLSADSFYIFRHQDYCQLTHHIPVLFQPVKDTLLQSPDGIYIDATYGRGGHARAILDFLSPVGELWLFDKDKTAIQHAQAHFGQDPRVKIFHGSYTQIASVVKEAGKMGAIQGILMDLGISSPQIDTPERGFSFMTNGPLDMRMDQTAALDAKTWLQETPLGEMISVFKRYGEEPFAARIAKEIVASRSTLPLETTQQLVKLIASCVPQKFQKKHPATRVFQAIRIAINQELEELAFTLPTLVPVLKETGRLAIITFHSLEDRMVKQFIRQFNNDNLPAKLPIMESQRIQPPLKIVNFKIKPSEEEVEQNIRSRSATLRVVEKQGSESTNEN